MKSQESIYVITLHSLYLLNFAVIRKLTFDHPSIWFISTTPLQTVSNYFLSLKTPPKC